MPKKSRGNKHPFAIYYTDGSYMIYDITMEDYDNITKALILGKAAGVETVVGFLMLKDVRSIIEQKAPEPVKEAKPDKPALPRLSMEEAAWIKSALSGIYDMEDEEAVN